MRIFLHLMWYFKTRKAHYVGGILMLMLVALLGLFPPRIVGAFVDNINHHTLTHAMMWLWLLEILAIALVMYVLRYAWRILLFGSAIHLSTLIRKQLYEHFTGMSPGFYHERRIGDLMAHATNDVSAVEATAMDGILTLVDSITTGGLVVLTMAITINWQLTLVALLPMPVMAYATSRYGSILHKRFIKAQAAFSDMNDKVQENISGVRAIKAFGQESAEIEAFSNLSKDLVDKNIGVAKIDALFDPTIALIVGLSYFLSFAVGSILVVHNQLTIGQLTTFSIYLGQLIWPMLAFGYLFNVVERGSASYDRIQELMAVQPEITDRPGAKNSTPSGNVAFQIQSFCYPSVTRPALSDLDVSIRKGQTLGIVGKTGSGKTTLLRLLMREFDVDVEGESDPGAGSFGDITIGGDSIYDVTRHALRQAIAYVPQEHYLFSSTIAENIAFGNPDASLAEIKSAAKLAAIHEDILQFQAGYATIVGERGVTLSGGQKQRLSIARALLLDAEILVLDDSLSAVDAKTEAEILTALKTSHQNRTTIISTHRLSAVAHANLIIVLDDGRIIERGTHEELMKLGGWYALIYHNQQIESLVEQGGV
jgi:ATP-binding cassette, subfamily B, multidrug efflux pump